MDPAGDAGKREAAFPQIRPVADRAVLVTFGEVIDPAVHERVRGLDAAVNAAPFAGFTESVPAYASVLVGFDPLVTDHAEVAEAVRDLLLAPLPAAAASRRHEVLVCYDAPFAPDLAAVAAATGLSPDAVIAAHLAGDYRVFLYGFAPGYAYLAGVPAAIRLPRKPAALAGVAAGSVIVAGPQCLVTTLTMPTGWWIIGRSPTRILREEADRPFLFDVGDAVTFRRVGREAMGAS